MGLSVLVQQIKRENRCDVFTAVRKLRAQRQAMMQQLVSRIFFISLFRYLKYIILTNI